LVVKAQRCKPFGIASVFIDESQSAERQGGFDVRALTEAERQYLTETQSLTRDEAGRDVLVGLTYEESSLLMAYRRQFATGSHDHDPVNLSIWLELAEKHTLARPRTNNLTHAPLTDSDPLLPRDAPSLAAA
jgi:hypothetical protein